ncbi:unnamed protein product [Camellia sinensis]
MSSEYYFLVIPRSGYSSSILNIELFLCVVVLAAIFVFWLSPGGLAWALSKARVHARTAIPGPSGLPLLGLVFAFTGSLTHRVLAKLSKTCKAVPLMAFSIGFTRLVISSQPDTAKDILSSSAFADRPVKESTYELLFHRAMGFAPYGEYWRDLWRISATHLFSPKRLASFGGFRRIRPGFEIIRGLMEKERVAEVKRVFHFGSLNNVMMSVFGKKLWIPTGRPRAPLVGADCILSSCGPRLGEITPWPIYIWLSSGGNNTVAYDYMAPRLGETISWSMLYGLPRREIIPWLLVHKIWTFRVVSTDYTLNRRVTRPKLLLGVSFGQLATVPLKEVPVLQWSNFCEPSQ